MKFTKLNIVHAALFLGVALLSACGGGVGGTTATSSFTIGGTVTGLTGTGLVLQNNAGDNLTVNANGNAEVAFTFATKVASGAGYNVKVITQPGSPGQTCTVNNGSGTATANVTGISVICSTNAYTIGGKVTGLTGTGLVLQNNNGDNLAVNASGNADIAFTFATKVASGAGYNVKVITQPGSPGQTCTVNSGSGTATANITGISIICSANVYTIGGTVTGLTGTGLVLQNNNGDNLAVNASGNADVAFTFATKVASGAGYNVKVITQPGSPGQTCIVNNGSGTAAANVTGISVICSTNVYTIGGTVTGLTGTGLVLQNNDGDNLAVNASGNADIAFTFATKVASGAGYNVKVLTQPGSPAQFCTVNNGTGTAAANVTGISVNCSTNAYTIGGKVTGLTGTGLVLQNNDGDNLAVNANGGADVAFTFATSVASGARFSVIVKTQPSVPDQQCEVGSGSGTVSDAAINSVAVTCSANAPRFVYVPRFAYVANNGDDTISIYTVNAATGQLRHNGYVAAGKSPLSLSIEPTGKFAYAANSVSGNISAYAINASTGQLTEVAGSPFAAGSWPKSVVYDPSGKFAYVASGTTSGTTITAYTIDAQSGALTLISAFTAGTGPNAIAITPNGKFAYVTNGTTYDISAFSIDASTGFLTVIDQNGATSGTTVAAGTEPRSISIDPSGKYAYVANSGTNNVSAYSINADTGVLTSIGNFQTGTAPKYVTVDPFGKFVYTANDRSNNVSAFSINTTGGLTEITGSPIMLGPNSYPSSINIDPSGKFAYVACPVTNEVFRYLIEANGALTSLGAVRSRFSGVSVALAKGTTAVTHTPKAAYVANSGASTVSQFTIDTNGGIAPMNPASVSTGTQPISISVDRAGRFAFVANFASNKVSVYSIDPGTRALTEVAGSPFEAGTSPTAVKVDPSGRFLYVSNYGAPGTGTISAYTINATTGALVAIAGSPFGANSGSNSIDIDPSGQFVYVTNLSDETISAFSIDPATGVLTRLDANSSATDGIQDLSVKNAHPVSITCDPTGRFVYVATACGSNWVFSVDAWSGLLSRVDTDAGGSCSASLGTPNLAAIDPSGSYLYSADYSTTYNVGAFGIDAIAGTVTPVAGSPFRTVVGTVSVTVDQSGSYVYAAGFSGVSLFKIGSGGVLSASGGIAAGKNPVSITTVGSVQ